MWHALDEWALRFNLSEEWMLENVRETLFTGAFTSNSERFPHRPRWDFSHSTWVMPDWATQDFQKPAEVSIPFDYEPIAETREAYRDRAHKRFEEALKVAVADLEAQLIEAGYREAPKIKVRPHHLDWLAITLVTRCNAEQLLAKWQPPDGIEFPNVSSVRRTLESVSDIVGVQLPKSRGR